MPKTRANPSHPPTRRLCRRRHTHPLAPEPVKPPISPPEYVYCPNRVTNIPLLSAATQSAQFSAWFTIRLSSFMESHIEIQTIQTYSSICSTLLGRYGSECLFYLRYVYPSISVCAHIARASVQSRTMGWETYDPTHINIISCVSRNIRHAMLYPPSVSCMKQIVEWDGRMPSDSYSSRTVWNLLYTLVCILRMYKRGDSLSILARFAVSYSEVSRELCGSV